MTTLTMEDEKRLDIIQERTDLRTL